LLRALLVKDPSQRVSDAGQVATALRGLLTGEATPALETAAAKAVRARRARWRRSPRVWIGVAAGVILAVGLALFLGRSDRTSESDATLAAAPAPEPKSIAVLPFVNTSGDERQEYFSDGISEELLNLLARIPGLKVISRTSAFSFKGQNLQIAEIARQLNVAHILEGSVRRGGDQVRITAQLIDAASDAPMWSETYDRTMEDIFVIQDEIAADVVAQLKVTLLGDLPTVEATDPEAYSLYLQGQHLRRLVTVESLEQSIALLQQALTLDSEFAAAWVGLADAYLNRADMGLGRPFHDANRLAEAAAERALAINPDFAPAHATLVNIAGYVGDLPAAAKHANRAYELDQGGVGLWAASWMAYFLGRADLGVSIAERLVDIDPINVDYRLDLAFYYIMSGRGEESIAEYRTALSLNPGRLGTHAGLSQALLFQGEPEAALEAISQGPSELVRLQGLASIHHALGNRTKSDAALSELIEKYERVAAGNIAGALALRGEVDRAFEWLDKAVQYGDGFLSDLSVTPHFTNLHSDPRWLPLLRSIGKAPEQLAAIEFDLVLPE